MPLSARHCLAIVKKKIVEVTTFISITVVNDASFSCNADRRHAWIQANKQFYARLYLFIQMQGASVFMLPQPLQGACRIPAESHRKEGTAPASPDLSGSTTGITPSAAPRQADPDISPGAASSGPAGWVLITPWPAEAAKQWEVCALHSASLPAV